jgi:hypothetical protein
MSCLYSGRHFLLSPAQGDFFQLRIRPQKSFRHRLFLPGQKASQLEGVGKLGAAVMIVRDNGQGLQRFCQLADPQLYLGQFLFIVVVIVGLVPAGLAEPGRGVSAVHPEVAVLADGALLQIERVPGCRVIEVADADAETVEKFQGLRRLPGFMPDLDRQAKARGENLHDFRQVPAVRIGVVEIVPELHEQVPQFAGFEKRLEAFVKLLCGLRVDFTFVCKILVQLCGEEKFRLARSSLQPRFCGPLEGRAVKSAIDFYAIHESADEFELVDF